VFETLLKPFKKLDLFAQSEPTVTDSKKTSITPTIKPDFDAIVKQTATPEPNAVQTPDLNYFETNGFTIGIDKRIPFNKVLAVKNAIIQTLN
jgi:hypothetical protein